MADEQPRWLTQLFGWYAMTVLGLGARTGLLDAVRAGPGTADEIAARAGVDKRNTLEWLRAMVAAGHLGCDEDRFTVGDETAFVFGPGFPVDARAVVDFVDRTSTTLPDVAEAMRTGHGVPPRRFHDAYGDSIGRINTPTYAAALVAEWIAFAPGLAERLAVDGKIADVASGNGDVVLMLARAFPRCEVTGYDLDPSLVNATTERGSRHGLANVRAVVLAADALPANCGYGLITCLDSFHHFGDPAAVASSAFRALAPGGVLLVAESASSGDLTKDAQSPFSVITYGAGLIYCLQENLATGGTGLSGGDGPTWVIAALEQAGFSSVATHESHTGYRIFVATR
jgi:2-polyprenyl-3-methyl-5-hydroxy-6-metoxy-1,4-benzoquinol methylase